MNIKRIKALIRKEFYQIVRDPSSWLIAVIFPCLLLFLYAFGVSLDMKNLKIGVVLEDKSPSAQDFYFSLNNSRFFDVDLIENTQKAKEKMVEGTIHGYVTVPFYFSEYKFRSPTKQAPIYVVGDGSNPNTSNFVQNYVQGAWSCFLQQEQISEHEYVGEPIRTQPRFWYNEELNSRHFLLPGAIAIIMTLIGSLLTALVIAREWERGTAEALMATPVKMSEIYIAKTISYFILGIGSMIICSFLTIVVFGVPFHGSYFVLTLVSAVFLLTALGTGLLISMFARNQFLAAQLSMVVSFLPAFMLSGFVFEISSMPFIIRMIAHAIPAKYMVSSLQTLFLAGNIWDLIFNNVLVMILIVFVLFSLILLKTKKRLD